jgi:uncharacterized damage-inducible protein DinB
VGDHRNARFEEADFSGARFHGVNLSNVSISDAWLIDVEISGLVRNLSVNGVDVTAYVEGELNRRHPERALLAPADRDGVRTAWQTIEDFSARTLERARALPPERLDESVNEEWSFVETLRHLLMAMDKWFTAPILGEGFHPIGLPNTGSADFPWPDLDRDAAPSYDEVLAARAQRTDRFRAWLDELDAADLTREVEVLENGTVTVHDCVFTVLEEEFEHNRYADRDLAVLESRAGGDV